MTLLLLLALLFWLAAARAVYVAEDAEANRTTHPSGPAGL
jgi:hypothetical protein